MQEITSPIQQEIADYIAGVKKSLGTVVSYHARVRVEQVLSEGLPKSAAQWRYIENQTENSAELRMFMIDWMQSQISCLMIEEQSFSSHSEEHNQLYINKRNEVIRFFFSRMLRHPAFSRLSREEMKEMIREAGRQAGVELQ